MPKSSLSNNTVIAYEPVWAIGTGKTATPDMIIDTHKMIRNILNDIGFDGQKISILYGGSVNRSNAKTLIGLKDVDGFLIGGASLDVNHFYDIYKDWKLNNNFEKILKEWLQFSYPLGTLLEVNKAGVNLKGKFNGLDSNGSLILLTNDNKKEIITGGDVNLIS